MSKWEMVRLGDAASYINGYPFKPSDWTTKGLPIIRIQNLTESSNVTNYYDKPYDTRYEVNSGDILISWSASLGVYEWRKEKALLNQHIFKVVFEKLDYDKKFFMYTVGQKIKDMTQFTHGSTMRHITKKYFDEILIPHPPISIQQNIANTLDLASILIEKRKEQIIKLDQLVKSQFIEMFGDPVTNPMGWERKTLEDITTKITDGKHGGCEITQGTGYYFVGAREIYDNKIHYHSAPEINYEEFIKDYRRCNLEQGNFVIVNTGATIGKSAIASNSLTEKTLLQKSVAMVKVDKAQLTAIYLQYCYMLNPSLYYVAGASAQPNLLLSQMRKTKLPLPPLELQNRFADFVQAVDKSKFRYLV